MYELWLPPKPAIIRAAEPWQIGLNNHLKLRGLPREVRRGIISEIKRLELSSPQIQREALKDLSKYSKLNLRKSLLIYTPIGWWKSTGNAITSITHVADTSSAGLGTITISASAQAGDVAVFSDFTTNTNNGTPPTAVNPGSEWTLIQDTTLSDTNGYRMSTYYRILDSGDPGSTITGMDDNREDKVMSVFRGNVAVVTVTPSTWNEEATMGNPASQSVLASGGTAPLVVIGVAAVDSGTAAFSTSSPAFDATVANSDTDIILGYKIYDSSPADHTIDMNDLGAGNTLQSGWLAFSA